MIDNKELAEYLYNEISEHQCDNEVRRTRPQAWPYPANRVHLCRARTVTVRRCKF